MGISKKFDDSNFVLVSYGFADSVNKAMISTSDYTILTFKMIGRLVTGEANVKNLSGPLSIAQFSGKSLEMGLSYFLYLLAILSVSLGVLNLLPIPMLDGGHLMFYAFEKILGRPLTQKTQEGFFRIGLFLLLSLMFFTTFNDLRDLGLF